MILRQLIIRHGRQAVSSSSRRIQRCYATDINIDNPIHRQSHRDHQPKSFIPGHPDEPSSILDAIGHEGTPATAIIEAAVEESSQTIRSLQGNVNTYSAGVNNAEVPSHTQSYEEIRNKIPDAPFANYDELLQHRLGLQNLTSAGTVRYNEYEPWKIVNSPPYPDDVDLPMLLANQCHLGHATQLWHPGNSSYIYGIRDGIHIISLEITLSYLRRAAAVVQEVARRGGIILFVGTRKNMREIVVRSAARANGYHIFQRWIPGSLTNGQQILDKCDVQAVNAKDEPIKSYDERLNVEGKKVMRPDLVICLNPIENEVCLHECGLYNVPTIGIVDTDVNPAWVTYPIPANDDSPRSVALVSGALSRAAQRGQEARHAEAEKGKTTYDTSLVAKYLKDLEELATMGEMADQKGGGDRDKVGDKKGAD